MVTPGGLVVLTDRRSASGSLVEAVREAIRCGAAWVVLRERDLPYARRMALAVELRAIVPSGRLIVSGPDPLGGSAVHLAGADPLPSGVASADGRRLGAGSSGISLIGRSWHGFEDLSGVDYVTVSPVYPTVSKPGYGPALGAAGAAGMRAPVPWLALGGIDSAERARECAAAGAVGIAVMGAVMRTPSLAGELTAAFAGVGAGRW
ncbi:thiamine phosphate synthase [Actinoplanes derwentensis]|uniref:thiamine phosphate synthase n=1 Tax=Actinoplanes derwentensis TaxID=113562 RepID=UPI000B82F90A